MGENHGETRYIGGGSGIAVVDSEQVYVILFTLEKKITMVILRNYTAVRDRDGVGCAFEEEKLLRGQKYAIRRTEL